MAENSMSPKKNRNYNNVKLLSPQICAFHLSNFLLNLPSLCSTSLQFNQRYGNSKLLFYLRFTVYKYFSCNILKYLNVTYCFFRETLHRLLTSRILI